MSAPRRSRRRARAQVQGEPSAAPLVHPPSVRRASLIELVYQMILQSVALGGEMTEVLASFMPLILNEVDALTLLYPEMREVLARTIERLWVSKLRDVPPPAIDPEDSAQVMYQKIRAQLEQYRERILEEMVAGAAVPAQEESMLLESIALSIVETACRHVFKLFGVLR